MRLFGLDIQRTPREKTLNSVDANRGWWPLIRESYAGAWQQNVEVKAETALSFHATFSCQTLIASDIAKLPIKLVRKDSDGIWVDFESAAFSPVLRKPNGFQNRIQFMENWVLSKLQAGNTYVLKQRDGRGVVTKLFILDPKLVTPLVSDSGDVFYELHTDKLSGVEDRLVVPAREIIHDRFNCFFHPLVGLSPIFANGLAATQGLSIQNNSTIFFQNGSLPGGILTAPGHIEDATAERLKVSWEEKFGGKNRGKVAVLGDGLKFEAMATKAVDAQLIEQLKWSAEVVCSTYHVPPYKIGIGQQPSHNNVQSLNTEYYSQCLQILIESIELCLDEGLNMPVGTGTWIDEDELLRMDSATQMDVLEKSKGKLTPNEQRKRLNAPPKPGGDTVYMQEQDHSLEWLARRDAQPIEPPTPEPAPPAPPAPEQEQSFSPKYAKALFARRKAA
ncbi:phage portal protein [Pelagibacterium sp.]|uniref:phage portal protein n=1 Tax=Pelagibacterium sp. TaxID=1967288 RepID=UPI003A94DE96